MLATLYAPGLKSYFARCWTLISNLGPGVAGRRRRFEIAKLLALLRSIRRQGLSRQAPAYLAFVLRTLLLRPRQIGLAIRLAIMGLHFEKFTRQTLATHDFCAAARAGYERVEREARAAAAPGSGLHDTLRRHGDQAVRRLRRLHRRLRPEFRAGLSPDLAGAEQAIRACVGESTAAELLRRNWPQLESWFSSPGWRSALEERGYALVERWRADTGVRTITLAPLLAQGRLRRSFEHYFGELGVRVLTLREQVARLAQTRLPEFLRPEGAPDRIVSYLGALGGCADTVVVPVAAPAGAAGERVQVLSAGRADRASPLPHVVCVSCEPRRPQLRASLIELGVALVGDAPRAERAFERAFALD